MTSNSPSHLVIKGAKTNNLKNISLKIPHNKLIVVTGVSGSGKSSLAFEIIAREGQRRYFETLPSFARLFMGKLNRPNVEEIEGLSPVIAIGQRTAGMHARSTVGTLSDIYDLFRLLFARTGESPDNLQPTRALFSFNSTIGKCKRCNGIGKEEQIDLKRLIIHPEKTIRAGALAPTLPNGYIMYSQVTIDVLNQVCEAEGFNVEIPWNELSDAQRNVVLYGSEKIKVPFGKHSLESRLKWTGIKAKPREEGHYKGMIPIMSDILRRDRNANILKYVESITCRDCSGARLNHAALSVKVHQKSIADLGKLELSELNRWIQSNTWRSVAKTIVNKIKNQIDLLEDLGLGHLTLDRTAKSLRASEIQRIRISNQILAPLSDVLYVFDEPSIGLHPSENERLIYHFNELVRKGNTVIVVEHDLKTIRSADHIIEIGPAAGIYGGQLVYNGSVSNFLSNKSLEEKSPTYRALKKEPINPRKIIPKTDGVYLSLIGCKKRNLKKIDVNFKLGGLNIVSGKSGAGKSTLVKETLLNVVQQYLGIKSQGPVCIDNIEHIDRIKKLIFVDHSPIGRTPRSNPATYLGISDHIRDLFAKQPLAKSLGFTKSRFSFNNKGGRCETCQGAGKTQIGMHYLGNVDLNCSTCNGERFNEKTLVLTYNGMTIAEVYKLSIDAALIFFKDQKKILVGLQILQEIGLGYLTLGQSSTTLSGGEAQRIKIANQLQKKDSGNTLYIIVEPSIGLHDNDIDTLLHLFDRIKKKGNTIVCIEQNEQVIGWSDWQIELGPESGKFGGEILYQGTPKSYIKSSNSSTDPKKTLKFTNNNIQLNGITTHGLKNIDVTIPKNELTVVTGLSGSGKSTLVYDTLFDESNARFTESLSTYNRSFLQQNSQAKIASYTNLGPVIGINRKGGASSNRSTVGTLSGTYDAFRLLYSRISQQKNLDYTAQHYSFNHHLGACPECKGVGRIRQADPETIIIDSNKSIFEGGLSANKALDYYGNLNSQFVATLNEVATQMKLNITIPWKDLDAETQRIILYGTGETLWNVTWQFKTKSRSGTQALKAHWLGFCNYINDEYQRKRNNKNIKVLEELLHHVTCSRCAGSRLKPELLQTTFLEKNIHELTQLSISSCLKLISNVAKKVDPVTLEICKVVLPKVQSSLTTIEELGLGYLSMDRAVSTLSGGEKQRIMLAGQLSNHLFGVIYVMDEPTIGLDKSQVAVLYLVLKKIIANGNTVVVVEHDPTFIQKADYIIEMGPGAGRLGGEVIFQGSIAQLDHAKETVTYQLLNIRSKDYNKSKQTVSLSNSKKLKSNPVEIIRASANNLKQVTTNVFPNQIICIKGVSGSGKSSLIKDVVYQSWIRNRAVHCKSINGLDQFNEVILVNQDLLQQSRLQTPVAIIGILEFIKLAFSKTEFAIENGLKKADFSYGSKNGKCHSCNGMGQIKVSMDFMSDIWLTCDVCNGMRYNITLQACKLMERSIGEVLQMTFEEVSEYFIDKTILHKIQLLQELGLGHLQLGQAGNTLSSGVLFSRIEMEQCCFYWMSRALVCIILTF